MVFLGGFHGTPLCTNGSVGCLMQLSVNVSKMSDFLTDLIKKKKTENIKNRKIAWSYDFLA